MSVANYFLRLFRTFDPRNATLADDELALLRELVRDVAGVPGPIVEIGTLIGLTTTEIALADRDRQEIITVDNYCWNPWALSREQHSATTSRVLHYLVQTNRVRRMEMDKDAFFQQFAGPPPALVFLDAWHTYEETRKDILWAKSAKAHVICGHDYCSAFPGVIKAVEEFGGPARLAGSLWVIPSEAESQHAVAG